ncbi:uncharacterized protein LOC101850134 isoform X1 [Aplysia californica]|uniref:Uncharacterized protein LOC101850134 isoform X1 n=1 Tax=Aplysia californica TaxID=6500 RepID=A0ABM0JE13_APLCA|nr:uncharacterized protein LOC101850134 isoform X1 [Aplysia californica]
MQLLRTNRLRLSDLNVPEGVSSIGQSRTGERHTGRVGRSEFAKFKPRLPTAVEVEENVDTAAGVGESSWDLSWFDSAELSASLEDCLEIPAPDAFEYSEGQSEVERSTENCNDMVSHPSAPASLATPVLSKAEPLIDSLNYSQPSEVEFPQSVIEEAPATNVEREKSDTSKQFLGIDFKKASLTCSDEMMVPQAQDKRVVNEDRQSLKDFDPVRDECDNQLEPPANVEIEFEKSSASTRITHLDVPEELMCSENLVAVKDLRSVRGGTLPEISEDDVSNEVPTIKTGVDFEHWGRDSEFSSVIENKVGEGDSEEDLENYFEAHVNAERPAGHKDSGYEKGGEMVGLVGGTVEEVMESGLSGIGEDEVKEKETGEESPTKSVAVAEDEVEVFVLAEDNKDSVCFEESLHGTGWDTAQSSAGHQVSSEREDQECPVESGRDLRPPFENQIGLSQATSCGDPEQSSLDSGIDVKVALNVEAPSSQESNDVDVNIRVCVEAPADEHQEHCFGMLKIETGLSDHVEQQSSSGGDELMLKSSSFIAAFEEEVKAIFSRHDEPDGHEIEESGSEASADDSGLKCDRVLNTMFEHDVAVDGNEMSFSKSSSVPAVAPLHINFENSADLSLPVGMPGHCAAEQREVMSAKKSEEAYFKCSDVITGDQMRLPDGDGDLLCNAVEQLETTEEEEEDSVLSSRKNSLQIYTSGDPKVVANKKFTIKVSALDPKVETSDSQQPQATPLRDASFSSASQTDVEDAFEQPKGQEEFGTDGPSQLGTSGEMAVVASCSFQEGHNKRTTFTSNIQLGSGTAGIAFDIAVQKTSTPQGSDSNAELGNSSDFSWNFQRNLQCKRGIPPMGSSSVSQSESSGHLAFRRAHEVTLSDLYACAVSFLDVFFWICIGIGLLIYECCMNSSRHE